MNTNSNDNHGLPDGKKVLWEEPNPYGNCYPNILHEGWVHNQRTHRLSLTEPGYVAVMLEDGSVVQVHKTKLVW